MATATTVKKSRTKKNEQKSQPKVYTFEWKGLNRDGKKTGGELKGASIAEVKSQLKLQGVNPKVVRKKATPLFARKTGPKGDRNWFSGPELRLVPVSGSA